MRYLSRNKVYQKIDADRTAKKIYIFCEGAETEIKYFKYFQGFSSNIDIIPIPNINGQSDPLKLRENAELLFLGDEFNPPKLLFSEEYKDEVWFVIDTDRWNESDKIKLLKAFCDTKNISRKQWFVAQSNPCFELWLYYHFYVIRPETSLVVEYASFKDFVNYVIAGGFDPRKMPIEIENAIMNSKSNFQTENNQPALYSTEVHLLGDVIVPFIKTQLDKAKEMMSSNTGAS